MAIFGFGKKKQVEEKQTSCDCGGACDTAALEIKEKTCDCGGACDTAEQKQPSGCCGEISAKSVEEAKQQLENGASVKVLGSGCKKCNQLEEATKKALSNLSMDTSIDHVTDFSAIASYGVMTTPALVVDGKVVSYGKVLKVEEVETILKKVRS